jgi:hypothetical protein
MGFSDTARALPTTAIAGLPSGWAIVLASFSAVR